MSLHVSPSSTGSSLLSPATRSPTRRPPYPPAREDSTVAPAVEAPPEVRKDKRANSAAFKVVPETRSLRDEIRNAAAVFAKPLDRSRPFARPVLMAMGEKLLADMGQPEHYLGFAMVMIAN